MLPETLIADNLVRWDNYAPSDGVVSRFTKDDWDSIVSSINTEDEWGRFLEENCHFFRCYTLKRISDEEPLAMVYLVNEDLNWGKVSIHGGGWGATSFLFRGYAVMIRRLLSLEIKVQTHTSLNNTRAIRFNRAIGFVPYRYTDNTVFMWISQRTLTSSKVYKWLYEKWEG